ncbi:MULTISPECIES: amino acid adenylation domain-containing protein [unclassified Rhizobium]|uniref:amino acid adenylation domain-containing protein n=1 Tax=unclassified Rhizobium TaxID=2613769 RepID=UPI00380B05CC
MTLDERLLVAARRFRDKPAINVAGVRASYEELFQSAIDVCEGLRLAGVQPGQLVALCAERTFAAYSSVLGILLAGCGYVPLNVTFPAIRNRQILSSSRAVALVVDEAVAAELEEHIGAEPPTLPLLATKPIRKSGALGTELDTFVSLRALTDQTVVYLLFTSGTTGVPKGVPINASNLTAYIDAVHDLMPIDSSDRLLQAVDLTFDLSVHDMMMCWLHGAELFVAPQNGAILAPRTIRANSLTACLLVPSAAAKSAELGLITPDGMPSLKYSLFAGEALPVSLSRKWQAAAPNATIFNMYGPTEGTIHTSYYRIDPQNFFDGAVTPIGWPIGEQRLSIRNGDGAEVAHGETGEIWLTGPQMTAGYWHAPALDAEKFVADHDGRWYRTGDAGRLDARHGVVFAGRLDRQIKIRGYRVELQDVEAAMASASQSERVAVVAWPRRDEGSAEAIIGFIAGAKIDIGEVKQQLYRLLPPYMLPAEIHLIEDLPVNVNGKIDYRRLEQRLAERQPA